MSYLHATIQYCPLLCTREEYASSLYAENGILDKEALKESELAFPDNVEIKLAIAKNYLEEGNTKQYEKLVREVYKSFPNSIPAKMEMIYHFYNDFTELRNRMQVTQIFQKEIDAIFNNGSYETVICDSHYLILLNVLITFYVQTNELAKAKHLFRLLDQFGFQQMTIDAAYQIQNKEKPFLPPSDPFEGDSFWVNDAKEKFESTNINHTPHYSVMYTALNTPLSQLEKETIIELSTLDNIDYVSHDMRWLIYQSFTRHINSDGEIEPDVIILFIFLMAHYGLTQDLHYLFTIMKKMPGEAYDEIFGDIGIEILFLPFTSLFAKTSNGLYEFLIDEDAYWHLQTIFIIMLCFSYKNTQDDSLGDLISKLYKHYLDNENKLIADLLRSMSDCNIGDHQTKIKHAYAHNLINTAIYGEIEEFSDEPDTDFFDQEMFQEDKNLEAFHNVFMKSLEKIAKFRTDKQHLDLDGTIQEYIHIYEDKIKDHLELSDVDLDRNHPIGKVFGDDDGFGFYDNFDEPSKIIPIRSEPKIGRNEPCPCGSGKKHKKCCWNS